MELGRNPTGYTCRWTLQWLAGNLAKGWKGNNLEEDWRDGRERNQTSTGTSGTETFAQQWDTMAAQCWWMCYAKYNVQVNFFKCCSNNYKYIITKSTHTSTHFWVCVKDSAIRHLANVVTEDSVAGTRVVDLVTLLQNILCVLRWCLKVQKKLHYRAWFNNMWLQIVKFNKIKNSFTITN